MQVNKTQKTIKYSPITLTIVACVMNRMYSHFVSYAMLFTDMLDLLVRSHCFRTRNTTFSAAFCIIVTNI